MGFGNIVSQVILFMSIMATLVVVSLVFNTFIKTTNVSLQTHNEIFVNKLETSFKIINVTYNELDENISFYLKNTGSIKLDPNRIDLFAGHNRFSRNEINVEISEETNLINPLFWDPSEILIVSINYTIMDNSLFRIFVQNGVSRSHILEA
ncbi:MAG: hypothetical protein ACMXX8_01025 [Candidatus Woesearchaeota archaeon]